MASRVTLVKFMLSLLGSSARPARCEYAIRQLHRGCRFHEESRIKDLS